MFFPRTVRPPAALRSCSDLKEASPIPSGPPQSQPPGFPAVSGRLSSELKLPPSPLWRLSALPWPRRPNVTEIRIRVGFGKALEVFNLLGTALPSTPSNHLAASRCQTEDSLPRNAEILVTGRRHTNELRFEPVPGTQGWTNTKG